MAQKTPIAYPCSMCKALLSPDEFARTQRERAKKRNKARCRQCVHDANIQRNYGVSKDDFCKMRQDQDGKCGCCRDKLTSKNTHVDHDHAAGNVRGLLCFGCNLGIGHFRDSPENCVLTARYLLRSSNKQPKELDELLKLISDLKIDVDAQRNGSPVAAASSNTSSTGKDGHRSDPKNSSSSGDRSASPG